MGRTGAGLVLAVLVVAALGAGYLAVNSGRQASTSGSTPQGVSTSTSRTSALAILAGSSSTNFSTSDISTSCPPITWTNSSGAATVSYQPAVEQIGQDPAFVSLTHGLCYSYALTDYGKVLNTARWENFTNFVFDHFNGTIIYPCGVFPAKLLVSQIQVSTVLNGTAIEKIVSMGLNNDTHDLNEYMACPYIPGNAPPVWVKSVMLVPPYTPAGPTIEVSLTNAEEQTPIVNLTAVLSLTGKNQTFGFGSVSASSPLLAGKSASQTETIVGPVSVDTNSTYPMTIEGSFQDGQTFTLPVTVEVQATNTSGVTPG